MPFPFLLWGAAAAVAAVGVKKGYDAYTDYDKAKRIGERAEELYDEAKDALDSDRNNTQQYLVDLGKLKVSVYSNQIKFLLDVYQKHSGALTNFNSYISVDNLEEVEQTVSECLEFEGSLAVTGAAGALAAFGATSAAGIGAAASVGGSLMGLSGAAATNATLAWLGAGSLATGGFGMAGGVIALGGIALAPVLAIGGFFMASKAEEALDNARTYRKEVDIAISKMKDIHNVLKGLREQAQLLSNLIIKITDVFNILMQKYISNGTDTDMDNVQRIFEVGDKLMRVLNTKILNEDGTINHVSIDFDGYLSHN